MYGDWITQYSPASLSMWRAARGLCLWEGKINADLLVFKLLRTVNAVIGGCSDPRMQCMHYMCYISCRMLWLVGRSVGWLPMVGSFNLLVPPQNSLNRGTVHLLLLHISLGKGGEGDIHSHVSVVALSLLFLPPASGGEGDS